MNYSSFVARCDLEVGDPVMCSLLPPDIYKIYDILTIHSYRTKQVDFLFHLVDSGGTVVAADFERKHLDRF